MSKTMERTGVTMRSLAEAMIPLIELKAHVWVLHDGKANPRALREADLEVLQYEVHSPKMITIDSRDVQQGGVFIAITGFQTDGHRFIESALQNGAAAIVSERPPNMALITSYPRVLWISVQNGRRASAHIAKAFFGNAINRLRAIGVTGTNGKTTVTTMLHHILQHASIPSGLLGTVMYKAGNHTLQAERTTPESLDLHYYFAQMEHAHCRAVVMEVSSHALVLHRTEGIDFEVAVFTNLTQDHLDFHGTMDRYCDAKKTLFDNLSKESIAVINMDSAYGERMIADTKAQVWGYSVRNSEENIHPKATLTVRIVQKGLWGSRVVFYDDIPREVILKQVGRFNVYNAAAAYLAAKSLGIASETILAALEQFHAVPGRMQAIHAKGERVAFVDYAHTPDALDNVLKTLSEEKRPGRKLIVVFGCGGNRDRTKRPQMAHVAETYGDYLVITSDNPRTEPIETIFSDIKDGLSHRIPTHWEKDRYAALSYACDLLNEGDALLVAGKGHEAYQEIDGVKYPFDDTASLREIFKTKSWEGEHA